MMTMMETRYGLRARDIYGKVVTNNVIVEELHDDGVLVTACAVGYCYSKMNHSNDPSAEVCAEMTPSGDSCDITVTITALRDMRHGEEVCIDYVDLEGRDFVAS